nr:zinc finger protein [Hymenolepis microstoma]
MDFSQPQVNTDEIGGNIESTSQSEPIDFSMNNLNNMQYMQMEGAIHVDPISPSENRPNADPTFIPHSSYRMNGEPVNQLLPNFTAFILMFQTLSALFHRSSFMLYAFNLEQLVNTWGGNWHANIPLSLNWNPVSNLNIPRPTQFSSDQTQSLEGPTNTSNYAQASTVSISNLRRGTEIGTVGAQGCGSMVSSFTNRETLNQRTIANPETISPAGHSSKPPHTRTRTQRRAKRQTQYSCSVCPESFRRVKDLDEHTKAVHGKYKCQVCGVKIANRSNLLRHSLKHSNQRPYECPICSRTYTRQDHLKRHMDVNHQGYGANRNMAVVNVAEVHTSTLTPQIPMGISV